MTKFETLVEESKSILALEDNWDDEGAMAIPREVYDMTIEWIRKYLRGMIIEAEGIRIDACVDGSIDLVFDNPRGLFNFKIKNGEFHIRCFFYEKTTAPTQNQ